MKDLKELCEAVELPTEVTDKVLMLDRSGVERYRSDSLDKLFCEGTWREGRTELKEQLGSDPDGIKVLACMLRGCLKTWKMYEEKDISRQIYIDTMKCFTRFVQEHRESYGSYGFDRDFWVVRQMSGLLFRLGELEYEMIREEGKALLSIHIPSDAALSEEKLQESYSLAGEFFAQRFPEYGDADMVCHSWLLSPTLKELLTPGSRILGFQQHFVIEETGRYDEEFLQWVFKRKDLPTEALPENTSLQRRMKEYLLQGGKVADARGTWRRRTVTS